MPPNNDMHDLLTNREKQLIRFLRQLEWGEVKVRVENGQPVLIYEAIKTLKLGNLDTTHPSLGNKKPK